MATDKCQLVESLEHEWRDALCSKDFDKLRSLIHPDFVLIGTRSTGPFRMGRDDWIDAIQRREIVSIDLEVRDPIVRDDMMLGTVFAKWKLKYLKREIEDCVVLTDVWICEDGRWQAIRRHSTPSPTGGCSAA